MGMEAVQRAAALLMACNKHLFEAFKGLLVRGGSRTRRTSHGHKPVTTTCAVLGRVNKRAAVGKRTHPQVAGAAAATLAPASGAGELWQRSILMGEKCDPINFSGAIYYDCNGRRLSGVPPRSPRHVLGSPRSGGRNNGFNSSPLLPLPPAAASPKWIARY